MILLHIYWFHLYSSDILRHLECKTQNVGVCMACVRACWTHFSSVTTCLSVFRACSRLWVCSSSLSMATWCCFLCCSSSRSAPCRAFILLHSLDTQTHTHISSVGTDQSSRVGCYWLTFPPACYVHAHSSPGSSVSHSVLLKEMLLEPSEPRSLSPATKGQHVVTADIFQVFLTVCGGAARKCRTWMQSFSFCLSRASVLSRWAELFCR